ncbi:hypothetical protein KFE80_07745 [bacterium SCSIO 12696]|nr:hypothetical protein KFE80_07745 [bacterium SCSIO 12696]
MTDIAPNKGVRSILVQFGCGLLASGCEQIERGFCICFVKTNMRITLAGYSLFQEKPTYRLLAARRS